jgi:hypothetical protein
MHVFPPLNNLPQRPDRRAPLCDRPQPFLLSALASASGWQWDAFALDAATGGRALSTLSMHLITGAGLVQALGLDTPALARWLVALEDGYGDNPFHNRVHAADVLQVGRPPAAPRRRRRPRAPLMLRSKPATRSAPRGVQPRPPTSAPCLCHRPCQTMHVLLTRGGLLGLLQNDPVSHLAALLAAAAHDFRHRGVSNDFLITAGDDLALLYNDTSPQENEHASAALRLLQQAVRCACSPP